jgi:hypothetical protein
MVLFVVVMGWFAIGSLWNVRKGNATLLWMQDGLPLLGPRTTVRWVGTTSLEMVIKDPRPPFENVVLVVFLEPRDVPWIWGVSRRRGRRDTLILRARLTRTPVDELEVLDKTSWSGRDAWASIGQARWSVREPTPTTQLTMFYKFERALSLGDALLEVTKREGMTVRRLSVQRGESHLQLHIDLPTPSTSAAGFFAAVRSLGEQAARA